MFDIVMGKTGSGKSMYLTYIAMKYQKKGINVYSNVAINGCRKVEVNKLGDYKIEDGLLIIDEAGFEFNSRDFKNFSKKLYRFFTMHRHYNLDVILAVQFWDRVDIVIRELLKDIYVCVPTIFPCFIHYKRIGVKIDIDDNTHQIIEKFKWIIFSGRYRLKCKYYGKFDSFYKDDLKEYPIEEYWHVEKKHITFKNKIVNIKNKYKNKCLKMSKTLFKKSKEKH